MNPPEDLKTCPDCGEAKPVADFGLNKRMADGRARYCKVCFRRRSTESYRKRMAEQGKTVHERVEVPEGHKYCPKCETIKSVAEFGRNRSQKDGLTNYCKPCHTVTMREIKIKNHGSERNYLLKHRYGITEEDVERMREAQGGVCAICEEGPAEHVDHCHATGKVRGLLCVNCNNGLGHFQDDVAWLRLAAVYADGVRHIDFTKLAKGGGASVTWANTPSRTYHLTARLRADGGRGGSDGGHSRRALRSVPGEAAGACRS